MSTRGFIGFVGDGEVKVAYNHYDSYPSGLGVDVLNYLRTVLDSGDGLELLRRNVVNLKVVDPDVPPTEEQKEALKHFANLNVSDRSLDDWYCLLYQSHGDVALMLSVGYIEDASAFPYDSLFAEWGYVIDVDAKRLEVYKGFQTEPHMRGRFATAEHAEPLPRAGGSTYYPVALVASFEFDELPDDEAFIKALRPEDEDED